MSFSSQSFCVIFCLSNFHEKKNSRNFRMDFDFDNFKKLFLLVALLMYKMYFKKFYLKDILLTSYSNLFNDCSLKIADCLFR